MAKTRIFEALEHAGHSQGSDPLDIASLPPQALACPVPDGASSRKRFAGDPLEKKMILLYQGICALAPGEGRVVAFTSAMPHEGASTIVRQLARIVAVKLNRKVAILDANYADPTQPQAFGLAPAHGWDEAVHGAIPLEAAFQLVADIPLHVSPVSLNRSIPPVFTPKQLAEFYAAVRARYDLALIDAPAIKTAPECLALCANADGIVLAVEAGKTRREVVKDLQEIIQRHGGKVLGVALTNRTLDVPKIIYDRT